jgi:hypothetical protein
MGADKQPDLDTWDDFAGDYIKAEFVKEFPCYFVVTGVNGEVEDGRNKLIAEVEYNKRKWKFDLNKTNQGFIRAKKMMPKDIIGKFLFCDKTKVRNPSTGGMVDSLIVVDIKEKQ